MFNPLCPISQFIFLKTLENSYIDVTEGIEPVKCASDVEVDLVGMYQVTWLNSEQLPITLGPGKTAV